MKKEIIQNYKFMGFGFPVIIPFAVFQINSRNTKYLEINMEVLRDEVVMHLLTHNRHITGAILHFVRSYMDHSTHQLAEVLDVSQQTISNWEKKKHEKIPLNDVQHSRLYMKLRQIYFNKREDEINNAVICSPKETSESPIALDALYS